LSAGAAAAKAIAAGHDLQTALAIGSACAAGFDDYGAGSGGATGAGFEPYAVVIVDEAEQPMRMWAVDATKEVLEGGEPSEVMAAALNQAGQQRTAQPAGKVERPRDNGMLQLESAAAAVVDEVLYQEQERVLAAAAPPTPKGVTEKQLCVVM